MTNKTGLVQSTNQSFSLLSEIAFAEGKPTIVVLSAHF